MCSSDLEDTAPETLENPEQDPVYEELREFIRSLDEDEQIALVALAWIGRGTYEASAFDLAIAEARRAHKRSYRRIPARPAPSGQLS